MLWSPFFYVFDIDKLPIAFSGISYFKDLFSKIEQIAENWSDSFQLISLGFNLDLIVNKILCSTLKTLFKSTDLVLNWQLLWVQANGFCFEWIPMMCWTRPDLEKNIEKIYFLWKYKTVLKRATNLDSLNIGNNPTK